MAAIRKHDPRHLITVGAIPWAMTWPNAKPLFYSKEVSKNLDFVSLHFYPKKGEVGQALKALAVYDIGKPIVIEEMFPLSCPVADLDQFIDGSKPLAVGWIGFYWGKTIAEYKQDERRYRRGDHARMAGVFRPKDSSHAESDAEAKGRPAWKVTRLDCCGP